MLKVEVFTSPSCPYCPMAEQVVEEAKKWNWGRNGSRGY